jgi:predicted TIM-barrel fold metal-dependent hydrolase
MPPKYREELYKFLPADSWWVLATKPNHGFDMDDLLATMDAFPEQVMVLTLACPPIELIADPKNAVEFARLANDGMAEMVAKYPDKFITAIAALPMNDMDAALKEADRCINELKFRGVQIYSPTNDKPIDGPEFLPLYEKMERYDLPIFLHPCRLWEPDYKGETESKYAIWLMFGWLFESSAAMTRLICSGIMEKYPNLKIVVHHTGAMVPFLESRLIEGETPDEDRKNPVKPVYVEKLTKPRLEYYKRFYAETEIRTTPSIMCAYHFFGPEHIVFSSGLPHGFGPVPSIKWSIEGIENMDISDKEKQMIFRENAINLLHLSV